MDNHNKIEFVYMHYYNYFFFIALNICHEHEMAKDIVQDAFISILYSKEVFANDIHAKRYLVGCVKYAAFGRLKKEKRINAMRRDFLYGDKVDESRLYKIYRSVLKIKCSTIRTIIFERYFNGKSKIKVAREYGVNRRYITVREIEGLKLIEKQFI